jgi:hypothetical protein
MISSDVRLRSLPKLAWALNGVSGFAQLPRQSGKLDHSLTARCAGADEVTRLPVTAFGVRGVATKPFVHRHQW